MALFGKKKKEDSPQKQRDAYVKSRQKQLIEMLPRVARLSHPMAAFMAGGQLDEDEQVIHVFSGEIDGVKSLVVATDKRIVVAGASGLKHNVRVLEYKNITEASSGASLKGASLLLREGSYEIEVKASVNPNGAEVAKYINQRASETRKQEQLSPLPGIDDLTKLAELHAQGVLTDEEFAAAKAKALGL